MAGKNAPAPQPQEVSAPRPGRGWIGTGFALGWVPSVSTGSLVALDRLHLSPSILFATVVLSPIVGWLLGLMGYSIQARIQCRAMIEEALARTLNQVAVEDARRGPVQAGQAQDATVKRLRDGSYQLTRSTSEVPTRPSLPESKSPPAPRENGHVRRGRTDRTRRLP